MSLDDNETGCEDAYTIFYEESAYFYNCVYDGDTGYCDPVRGDQCTLGAIPSCNDYEVDTCEELLTEPDCEQSYIEGELANYDCGWIFGACYTGYQECEVTLDECNSVFTFGCPLINNSRECEAAYSEFEGTYNCEWITGEGEYCWFGDVCEKVVYEQCNSIETDSCYNESITNESACNARFVEGRDNYGWNCLWYDGGEWTGCYYAESCHEGSAVTTTLAPMVALGSTITGFTPVADALIQLILAFIGIIIVVAMIGVIKELIDAIGKSVKKGL
jgi:hypothetical protein